MIQSHLISVEYSGSTGRQARTISINASSIPEAHTAAIREIRHRFRVRNRHAQMTARSLGAPCQAVHPDAFSVRICSSCGADVVAGCQDQHPELCSGCRAVRVFAILTGRA